MTSGNTSTGASGPKREGSQARSPLLATLAFLTATLVGCEDPASGLLSCGEWVCGPHEVCDRSGHEPRCVCREGYAGESCDGCASGYLRTPQRECVRVPIDCDDNPEICGPNGTCAPSHTSAPNDDTCECSPGWDGQLCESCAAGFQDHDRNDTCEPDCYHAALDCTGGHLCNDDSGFAVCECPTGTTGDDCELCVPGYRDNGSSCVPTCASLEIQCGPHEVCSDAGMSAACVCSPGYTGPTCSACADGYHDTVRSGECLPSCSVAELACGDHASCQDDVGSAYCDCDVGWAGSTCDRCAPGYEGEDCNYCASGHERIGDGPCEQSCNVTGCPPGRHCSAEPGVLGCVCDVGTMGPDCSECDIRYASDGLGHCLANVSSAHTLIGLAEVRSTPTLVAIAPSSGSVIPLRTLNATGLAFDPAGFRVFASSAAATGELDLVAGELDPGSSELRDGPLTFDLTSGNLLAVDTTGELVEWEIEQNESSSIGPTGLDVVDLAYASVGPALLALTSESPPGMYLLDPNGGGATFVAELPIGSVGLASSPSGSLYVTKQTTLDPHAAQLELCRTAAANLGLVGYASAAGTTLLADATALEITLENQRVAGPELVALTTSEHAETTRTVQVDASNPDAVFCLTTENDSFELTVPSNSHFAALVYFSARGELDLNVGTGFPVSPRIHLGPAAEITAPEHPAIRRYDEREWTDRRLPSADAPSLPASGFVLELDPDGALLHSVPLEAGVVPIGALSPWMP